MRKKLRKLLFLWVAHKFLLLLKFKTFIMSKHTDKFRYKYSWNIFSRSSIFRMYRVNFEKDAVYSFVQPHSPESESIFSAKQHIKLTTKDSVRSTTFAWKDSYGQYPLIGKLKCILSRDRDPNFLPSENCPVWFFRYCKRSESG
jgi:hypothetical protein